MKRIVFSVIGITTGLLILLHITSHPPLQNLSEPKLKQEYVIKPEPSVDHSLFEELQRGFASTQAVTEACIECHNQRNDRRQNQ